MNLLHPPSLKQLCTQAGMRPSKRASQHFLVHGGTLARIVDAVDPHSDETILEIGAGFGTLTIALAQRGARIIAIERDAKIVPILREVVAPHRNVEVVEGDALRLFACIPFGLIPRSPDDHVSGSRPKRRDSAACFSDVGAGLCPRPSGREGMEPLPYAGGIPRQLAARSCIRSPDTRSGQRFVPSGVHAQQEQAFARVGEMLRRCALQHALKIAANLPYAITSDVLTRLFDAVGTGALPPPRTAVFLLQSEVVDRLTADPTARRERRAVSALTILAQLHCTPRRVARVPASHFWPAPKVASAIVAFEAWRTPEEIAALLGSVPRDTFLALVRRCFAHRRRQIAVSLRGPVSIGPKQSRPNEDADALAAAGVAPTSRPEELTFVQWIALARALWRA